MTLSTRLWLLGAGVPTAVLAGVLLIADQLLHLALTSSLDRRLLAQAAVESVSLFDGPDHLPHLHMERSPLVDSVRAFAPEGVLFGPDGEELVRFPPGAGPREVVRPGTPGDPPELATVEVEGANVRRLLVSVRGDDGRPYLLRLSVSLAVIEASTTTFHWVGLVSTLAAGGLLALAQLWQGRRLRARLAELRAHLEAVRGGDLTQALAPEVEHDELTDLREVLTQATAALRDARAAEERLVADAAHELRTPLTLMRTTLDLALRRERSREELKGALEEAKEEVERLSTLANRLLDAVALREGALCTSSTDLSALAHAAAEAVRAAALERGVIVRVAAPHAAPATVDAGRVRQALDNLLSNALKFAPPATEVVVGVARNGAGWSLWVGDEGPGIPPGEREAMFEPFHRAPGASPGAGLGLTIVREVARLHGGRAYVADVPRGTEVHVELPQ